MSAFDPITAIAEGATEVFKRLVREKMSEKEATELANNFQLEMTKAITTDKKLFHNFILRYEGAAPDYAHITFIGPLILLLRAIIRPFFTFAVAYWDFLYFSATDMTLWNEAKARLLFAVNIIVLIFWFGERSVKAVMPFLKSFLEARK